MEVKEVFQKIKASSQSIRRFEYRPYSMRKALKVFYEIGKSMYPDFVIDDDNIEVFKNLIRWVHACTEKPTEHFIVQDPKSREKIPGSFTKGIYLAGPTGAGKTAAIDVMKEYAKIDSVQLLMNGSLIAINPRIYRTDDVCETYSQTGTIQAIKNARFVVFHDIASDSEPEESVFMGNRLKVMQNIIESRGDKKDLLTFFTSNVPFVNPIFQERYGDRVVSRMYKMCNYMELKGKDRRKL
jgi:hypothetical protein